MKTKIIAVLALIALAIALFGAKAVWSHVTTVRDEIQDGVRNSTPADYEVKRIKTLLADMSKDLFAFEDKIAEIENTAAAQRKDVKKLEQSLAQDHADLLAERNFLAQENEVFEIHGQSYSRAQVEASAEARMARIQRNQATLDTKKQAIERLEADVQDGRAQLKEAVAARAANLQELEVLSAELANAQLRQGLEALAAPLRDGVMSRSQSELAKSMKAFADRVREAKQQVDVDATLETGSAPAIIPHEDASRPGLLEQIDQVLVPAPATAPFQQDQ